MLLTLLDVENKLHVKFALFQGEMDDLILKKRNGPPDNLAKLDSELNIKICDDFLSFVNTYDFDNFSLGNVAFGSGENYMNTLIELNKIMALI